jgi:uncharacterized protein (DUF111 family)
MLLMVNVDDVAGEIVPHVIDGLMARGAKSVHVVPAITKKGRPEFIFFVDVDAMKSEIEALAVFMAGELGTIGVRTLETGHLYFDYRIAQVRLKLESRNEKFQAIVRVKQIYNTKGDVLSAKADFDDVKSAMRLLRERALERSFKVLKGLVEQTALGQQCHSLDGLKAEMVEEDIDSRL